MNKVLLERYIDKEVAMTINTGFTHFGKIIAIRDTTVEFENNAYQTVLIECNCIIQITEAKVRWC